MSVLAHHCHLDFYQNILKSFYLEKILQHFLLNIKMKQILFLIKHAFTIHLCIKRFQLSFGVKWTINKILTGQMYLGVYCFGENIGKIIDEHFTLAAIDVSFIIYRVRKWLKNLFVWFVWQLFQVKIWTWNLSNWLKNDLKWQKQFWDSKKSIAFCRRDEKWAKNINSFGTKRLKKS